MPKAFRPQLPRSLSPEPSAAECVDEPLRIDARLPQDAAEGSSLDLTMKRHDTASGAATHHHVAPPLTHDDEAETLEASDGFSPRDVREFRQRGRCGRW